jgi:uncharacterized protein YecE (DUF72 family)
MGTLKAGRALIGTSGWNYRHWADGVFYPPACREPHWLEFYASAFDTVEINNTFYHLPEPGTFGHWHDATPAGFSFAVKASRFITHMKKLAEPESHVSRFLAHAAQLRRKLGVVLFQLPPFWKFDGRRLAGLLDYMASQTIVPGLRVAVEIRHPSWHCDECHEILRSHHAALAFTDSGACPVVSPATADFIYLRRHGPGTPASAGYPQKALRRDADNIRHWLAEGRDACVYFNNDAAGHAPRDARRLAKLLLQPPTGP